VWRSGRFRRGHNTDGAIEAGSLQARSQRFISADHNEVTTRFARAASGSEEHAEPRVVARRNAIEVDDELDAWMLGAEPHQRTVQYRDGGEVDLTTHVQNLVGTHSYLPHMKFHTRDPTGAPVRANDVRVARAALMPAL
jgi:hypothetical protein